MPNCEVVQREEGVGGVEAAAIRLCSRRGAGKEAEWRCRIRREGGTKREIQVGWQRVEGLERRAEHRGGNAEPNLLPSGASTFHPIVPPPSFQ